MNRCLFRGMFGHDPSRAGEGCVGCDAENARLVEKHVGPVMPGSDDADREACARWLERLGYPTAADFIRSRAGEP